MELTEFLLARIAEDEGEARRAMAKQMGEVLARAAAFGSAQLMVGGALDPRRLFAECEAKRRIVALWAEEWPEWHGFGSGVTRTRMTDDQYARVRTAECVLGYLALPYADHPEFREEWRP